VRRAGGCTPPAADACSARCSPINAAGTAIALAGVFLYSRVTASKGKKSE
jgi:hypothetical protein